MKQIAFVFAFISSLAVILVVTDRYSKDDGGKCIAVFYDNSKVVSSFNRFLSHFPDYQKVLIPIEEYQSGQLGRCQASFVVNTEFDNHVSRRLVDDYIHADRNVIWMGYNIWHLGEQLNKKLGLRYMGSVSKSQDEKCALVYRGHSVRCEPGGLSMQPELVPTNEVRIEIIAESRVRGRELLPYVVRSKNLFYMADVSFGEVFKELLTEFVGTPMRIKPLKPRQVAGPG
jgi:hypothetical protein